MTTTSLPALHWDHRFLQLPSELFTRLAPTPLASPQLIAYNPDAAALLDFDPALADSPDFIAALAGNSLLPGAEPLATVYGGHQFGVWAGQLGDGRAIALGEAINASGARWELQLKGAGPTPYSRGADGRAVLRSTIREYLCSEAMHGLGIPTTRALSIVHSQQPVRRETLETAAVLCRLAPTHLRFGHFEWLSYRQRPDLLRQLADHVIELFYPQFSGLPDRYARWLREITERTARLMAQWQTVGFCHGVMNTDNFSILGLTIDYGPFGFIDGFDAGHICNHSDEGGRYAYDRQPSIGQWNCAQLLNSCLPLLHETPEMAVEIGTALLDAYGPAYAHAAVAGWRAKLGLITTQEADATLINRFLSLLHKTRADFTLSFRRLAEVDSGHEGLEPSRDHIADPLTYDSWISDYRARLQQEASIYAERRLRMNAVNPLYVLRNHLAQQVITDAENGDASGIDRLRRVLARPYTEQVGAEAYALPPPAELAAVSVSCSS